ncbi:MAG: sialate O-acetylesterase [Marinilabiliaceae bacterium]
MKKTKYKQLVLTLGMLFLFPACFSGLLFAEVTLPKIFSDNMVLQRGKELRIWGNADSGEKITVSLGPRKETTRANNKGKWEIRLSPFRAGGPHQLIVKGENTIAFKNVMIGDVWLASGQSNMEWSVDRSDNAEEEIQLANFKDIRLFTVPREMASTPQSDFEEGQWFECTPETVGDFSAVAYFFGRNLHNQMDVPIGLINSSWGGTVAETWISPEVMKKDKDFKAMMSEGAPDLEEQEEAAREKMEDWLSKIEKEDKGRAAKWENPETKDEAWEEMTLPVLWEQAGLSNLDGVVWFRKKFHLSEAEAGRGMILNLGPVDDSDFTYVNGKLIGKNIDQYDLDRRYNVPAENLKPGENVIAVRVVDTGGGGGFSGTEDQLYYMTGEGKKSLAGQWKYHVGVEGEAPSSPRSGPNICPSLLFNGMIHPITSFPIRGTIWYQGESNASRAWQYRRLFRKLIKDWRSQWNQPDMPFLFVQLANFMKADHQPVESEWAELREAQALALELPHTGMAVTIDIGEADDIHPRNKQDVGKRLALSALKVSYDQDIVHSGPMYESFTVRGNKAILEFSSTGSGLVADDKYGYLKGFAIAGEDQEFHWARARIEDDKVMVWSDQVEKPVAVRYAWGNNPEEANLYNEEGLPAAPFRTDNWEPVTKGKK